MGKRFLVNETFTTDDGTEYVGGGIYDISEKNETLIERWIAEGKVRDPKSSDDVEQTIDEAKAQHEAEDNGDDDDDDDDEDMTPEEIDRKIEEDDK